MNFLNRNLKRREYEGKQKSKSIFIQYIKYIGKTGKTTEACIGLGKIGSKSNHDHFTREKIDFRCGKLKKILIYVVKLFLVF